MKGPGMDQLHLQKEGVTFGIAMHRPYSRADLFCQFDSHRVFADQGLCFLDPQRGLLRLDASSEDITVVQATISLDMDPQASTASDNHVFFFALEMCVLTRPETWARILAMDQDARKIAKQQPLSQEEEQKRLDRRFKEAVARARKKEAQLEQMNLQRLFDEATASWRKDLPAPMHVNDVRSDNDPSPQRRRSKKKKDVLRRAPRG